MPFEGRHQLSFEITPDTYHDQTVLSPQTPEKVSVATNLTVVGTGGYFATLDREGGGAVHGRGARAGLRRGRWPADPGGPRSASTVYPDEVRNLYLGVSAGQLGLEGTALRAKIMAEASHRLVKN